MKSKMLLALAGLLIFSMLVIPPASAGSITYRAYGTLDGYNPETESNASIVGGFWSIKIKDDTVNFKASYLELNVGEQIPGTYDLFFRVILTDVTVVSIVGSYCEVEGTLVLYKIGYHHETGEFGFYNPSLPATIVIDPPDITIYLPTAAPPYEYIAGTTLFVYS